MTDLYNHIKNSHAITVMGILNVTPDSFSDGGKYHSLKDAVNHAVKLIDQGADIIDIGGESTRPGSESVSVGEELERVIPVIKDIISLVPNAVVSIDTTKSVVAEESIKAGARLINDISGGVFDPNIFKVASKNEVPLVIMHIKGTPRDMQNSPYYENIVQEISDYFLDRIEIANANNVYKIILDPGIGFGKSVNDNYEILKNIGQFNKLNYPIMIGVSKKSFLGKSLNLSINERENSTIIAETMAVLRGAKIIRTHNVKNVAELKTMLTFLDKTDANINV